MTVISANYGFVQVPMPQSHDPTPRCRRLKHCWMVILRPGWVRPIAGSERVG